MIISLQLRAIAEKTKPYFQLLGCESPYPEQEYSRRSRDHEVTVFNRFLNQCLLRPSGCLIYRRWTYESQPETRYVIRPAPRRSRRHDGGRLRIDRAGRREPEARKRLARRLA